MGTELRCVLWSIFKPERGQKEVIVDVLALVMGEPIVKRHRVHRFHSVEEARAAIREIGVSVRFKRGPMDNPAIMELWGSAPDEAGCRMLREVRQEFIARRIN
jgi:hypothetical protein